MSYALQLSDYTLPTPQILGVRGCRDVGQGCCGKCSAQLERGLLTSIHVVAAKVVPVEEHELNPVALVEGHQTHQQQQDHAQAPGQLHRVHQLCWREGETAKRISKYVINANKAFLNLKF